MKPRESKGEDLLRSDFWRINKSNICGNINGNREIRLNQRWKKSWHENILTSFGILAISFYSDIGLTWFLQPLKEDLTI